MVAEVTRPTSYRLAYPDRTSLSRVSIGGTPADIPDEKFQRQPEGQAQRSSANISLSTPWLDPQHDVNPGVEYGNTVERMAKGLIADIRRLRKWASSESELYVGGEDWLGPVYHEVRGYPSVLTRLCSKAPDHGW